MAKNKDFDDTVENVDDYFKKRKQNSEADEDLEDIWYGIQDEFRIRYPILTDEDVNVQSGQFHYTLDRISRRLNRLPEEVRREIENWQ